MNMAITAPLGRYNWMKVADIMTKDPLTVAPVETIGQAEDLMNTNKIRQLPVAQGKDLVGIVTDRDIRSFLSGSLFESVEARENALNTKVREIMTTEPMTVSADDDLQEAVELMIEEKIGGIPVVDQAEGLVGIVTLSSAFFVKGGERQSADSSGYLVVHHPPGR
jgi:acetoin utilization protein AcuB